MENQEINKKPSSRRDWLRGPAALLGAGAVSSILARAQMTPQTVTDIKVMNFALRVENLEAAFFQQGVTMFTPADFQKSDAAQSIGGSKIGSTIYAYLMGIAQNEQDHVKSLIQVIYNLDGTPQPPECYNFNITTPDSFLQIAQAIENMSVMAYTGVIVPQFVTSNSTIYNAATQALMASISSVEGRHAAYFSLLNQAIPFPTALEGTRTMAETLAAIGPFLAATGCNPPPVPLTWAVAGPAKNSVITTHQNTVQLDASLSTSATGSPLTYLWQQNLGSPDCTILNLTSVTPTVILLGGAGVYTITLKVSDSAGGSDQDTLKINYQL